MNTVNLIEKFSLFTDYWSPKVVGELNGQQVKLVKFKGQFTWHHHDNEDELFYVVKGSFTMEFRDKNVEINQGEFKDFFVKGQSEILLRKTIGPLTEFKPKG